MAALGKSCFPEGHSYIKKYVNCCCKQIRQIFKVQWMNMVWLKSLFSGIPRNFLDGLGLEMRFLSTLVELVPKCLMMERIYPIWCYLHPVCLENENRSAEA